MSDTVNLDLKWVSSSICAFEKIKTCFLPSDGGKPVLVGRPPIYPQLSLVEFNTQKFDRPDIPEDWDSFIKYEETVGTLENRHRIEMRNTYSREYFDYEGWTYFYKYLPVSFDDPQEVINAYNSYEKFCDHRYEPQTYNHQSYMEYINEIDRIKAGYLPIGDKKYKVKNITYSKWIEVRQDHSYDTPEEYPGQDTPRKLARRIVEDNRNGYSRCVWSPLKNTIIKINSTGKSTDSNQSKILGNQVRTVIDIGDDGCIIKVLANNGTGEYYGHHTHLDNGFSVIEYEQIYD